MLHLKTPPFILLNQLPLVCDKKIHDVSLETALKIIVKTDHRN